MIMIPTLAHIRQRSEIQTYRHIACRRVSQLQAASLSVIGTASLIWKYYPWLPSKCPGTDSVHEAIPPAISGDYGGQANRLVWLVLDVQPSSKKGWIEETQFMCEIHNIGFASVREGCVWPCISFCSWDDLEYDRMQHMADLNWQWYTV